MAVYPAIRTTGSVSIRTQMPYGEAAEFAGVVTQELECGKSYALNWQGSDPETVTFTLRYSVITPSELAIVENFFTSMQGRLGTFEFTDDNGTTWPKVRFDQDELRIEYVGPGQYSVEVRLRSVKW